MDPRYGIFFPQGFLNEEYIHLSIYHKRSTECWYIYQSHGWYRSWFSVCQCSSPSTTCCLCSLICVWKIRNCHSLLGLLIRNQPVTQMLHGTEIFTYVHLAYLSPVWVNIPVPWSIWVINMVQLFKCGKRRSVPSVNHWQSYSSRGSSSRVQWSIKKLPSNSIWLSWKQTSGCFAHGKQPPLSSLSCWVSRLKVTSCYQRSTICQIHGQSIQTTVLPDSYHPLFRLNEPAFTSRTGASFGQSISNLRPVSKTHSIHVWYRRIDIYLHLQYPKNQPFM